MTFKSVALFASRMILSAIILFAATETWALSRFLINAASDGAVFLGTIILILTLTVTPYYLFLTWRPHEETERLDH